MQNVIYFLPNLPFEISNKDHGSHKISNTVSTYCSRKSV